MSFVLGVCLPVLLHRRGCRIFQSGWVFGTIYTDKGGSCVICKCIYLFFTHTLYLSINYPRIGVIIVPHTYVLRNAHRT